MEWHSTAVSVSRLSPATEVDVDLADINFANGGNNAVAAQEASE